MLKTMAIKLTGPVGDLTRASKKGNKPEEVKAVKKALIAFGLLAEDDISDAPSQALTERIKSLQTAFGSSTDGRMDPGGKTLKNLNALIDGKTIVVNLRRQILDAFNKQQAKAFHFNCASGDNGHPTPPGYYAIYRKEKIYRSKKYDAQMNYAMFFSGGYAIHMSQVVGLTSYLKTWGFDSLGSHGCVRLPEDDAAALFAWAEIGSKVLILSN